MTLTKLACLGLAGAAGTLARFWMSEGVKNSVLSTFPWGTWAVNILGCFLFGLVWVLAEERLLVPTEFRFFALTGFMGAFTTFSTYMFESVDLLRHDALLPAIANLVGQNVVGFAAVIAGMALARLFA